MQVQLPLFGKAGGHSRELIYQSYNGKTYARSMPLLYHYPDTPAQQITQAKFYDLQRSWLPAYKDLSTHIARNQRNNKNPFNMLSKGIYKIFHPFQDESRYIYPSNFGLDPKNRVRPYILEYRIFVEPRDVNLEFEMSRPFNDLQVQLTTCHIILFNITSQTMIYTSSDIIPDQNIFVLKNTNEWKPTDKIKFYCALSGKDWLGNFNLIKP